MSATWVVSDVHGYLADLRQVLEQAGLADAEGTWTGGDAELWVLGDLVDRGPDGIGVVRYVRSLQEQAPEHVRVLMGNHEALMLGYHLFPGTGFAGIWRANGGHASDQEGLDADDVAWLRSLPVLAHAGSRLLAHSDTLGYLEWGGSVEEVNATVTGLLAGDDPQQHFDVFATLTERGAYTGPDGPRAARTVLDRLGGEGLVHGHSIIGTLLDAPSEHTEGPLAYADDLVLAIDGGRYDGGPLLLVPLS